MSFRSFIPFTLIITHYLCKNLHKIYVILSVEREKGEKYYEFKKYTKLRFLSELIAAMVMGILAVLLNHFNPQMITDNILIGALMTLVPGLAITNALRDLFMGDLLSGIMRMCEAVLTALALGGGVALVLKFIGV